MDNIENLQVICNYKKETVFEGIDRLSHIGYGEIAEEIKKDLAKTTIDHIRNKVIVSITYKVDKTGGMNRLLDKVEVFLDKELISCFVANHEQEEETSPVI